MAKKLKPATDISTEEKIKDAARIVFTQKGFAATRTRDIAEAAGINLALLNYYFRSKQKLFEEIMLEKVQQLFGLIAPVLYNPDSTLESKIETIVSLYIDMITEHPDLPIFVLSEIRNHPEHFAKTFKVGQILYESAFIKQLKEKRPDINPLHFLMNTLGMIIFPFIARPVFEAIGAADPNLFNNMMNERKSLIPEWTKAILDTI
ncbi:MAG: TetR/AcrR family transcriptional regulator [Saprospiraceae bacterium]|nr:TetR/AcrR family transcriptional regulator [Saprospiraceae bacterium]